MYTNIDDFDAVCVWLLIVEKDDDDYDIILTHFDEYDELFLKQLIKSIKLAKNGYIEKSKDASHVYIFVMNNGDISIINNEQLLKTQAYNRLYDEAISHICDSVYEEYNKDMREKIIIYRDYLNKFISDNQPHLCFA
jgi:hypothetical protein